MQTTDHSFKSTSNPDMAPGSIPGHHHGPGDTQATHPSSFLTIFTSSDLPLSIFPFPSISHIIHLLMIVVPDFLVLQGWVLQGPLLHTSSTIPNS